MDVIDYYLRKNGLPQSNVDIDVIDSILNSNTLDCPVYRKWLVRSGGGTVGEFKLLKVDELASAQQTYHDHFPGANDFVIGWGDYGEPLVICSDGTIVLFGNDKRLELAADFESFLQAQLKWKPEPSEQKSHRSQNEWEVAAGCILCPLLLFGTHFVTSCIQWGYFKEHKVPDFMIFQILGYCVSGWIFFIPEITLTVILALMYTPSQSLEVKKASIWGAIYASVMGIAFFLIAPGELKSLPHSGVGLFFSGAAAGVFSFCAVHVLNTYIRRRTQESNG